jgi:hypothetical protein
MPTQRGTGLSETAPRGDWPERQADLRRRIRAERRSPDGRVPLQYPDGRGLAPPTVGAPDLLTGGAPSTRPLLGTGVMLLKRGLRRLLAPDMLRPQDAFNRSVAQALELQAARIDELRAALDATDAAPAGSGPFSSLDFEAEFRGEQDSVRTRQRGYVHHFEGRAPVLDIGCGRG